MTSRRRAAGIAGGVLGAAATVTAAAVAHRNRTAAADSDHAPLDVVPPTRECTVTADDGVPLSVEELCPLDGGEPALTVVLVHGYTLDRRCWYFQRRALAESTDPRVRVVLYDQRSHGRSGRSSRRGADIGQLGRDLAAVLRAVAPDGPVVLAGHSMGGMTIMALAEEHPELFADRVCGVALVNTTAGDVGRTGLIRPFLSRRNPLMALGVAVVGWQPEAIERGRRLSAQLARRLTQRFAFGARRVEPALVELMHDMISSTPVEVMAAFLATLGAHDRYAALAGLRHTRVLVIGADADRLVPFQHSEAIAALLPDAELVRVRGAGHMAMLEQPDLVTGHLLDLLRQCPAPAAARGA